MYLTRRARAPDRRRRETRFPLPMPGLQGNAEPARSPDASSDLPILWPLGLRGRALEFPPTGGVVLFTP